MARWFALRLAIAWALLTAGVVVGRAEDFRPPAVPLVTVDPYTSCWSMSDKLFADWPRHWTGKIHAMSGLVRVDGKPMRFMGRADEVAAEALQLSLEVQATQTI